MAIMIVSETQPMQIITFNLRYLNAVELKRIMLQSSMVRVTRSLRREEGGHRSLTTPDSNLLRSITSFLPKLTAIELEQVEEHAKEVASTMLLQKPQHVQTESTSKGDESVLSSCNGPCRATPTKINGATAWRCRVLYALNYELKSHLAKQPLDEDWTIIMQYYIEQAAPVPSNVPCRAMPPKLNEAAEWPRRTFIALNTELKLQLAKEKIDEDWTNIMDSYIEQAAVEIRQASPFRLMDLPVEIRHLIYGLVVTPEMAEAHVRKNKIPTFFQISHNMSDDFAAFYYGREVFQVELLEPSTSSWKIVENPVKVQAMFEEWAGCAMYDYPKQIAKSKAYTELKVEDHPSSVKEMINNTFKSGVASWLGAPKRMAVSCLFNTTAQPQGRGARMERMSRTEAKEAKRSRIAALYE